MVFGNDLLIEMQEFHPGMKVCEEVVNCVAFADDITLMATCKADLQTMFDAAYRYSNKWRYEYNPTKCAVMIFGKDGQPRENILLGRHVIKVSETEPHLGSVLAVTDKLQWEFIKKRIKCCQCI